MSHSERGGVPDEAISPAEYERAFGEPVANTLDLDTWTSGENLAAETQTRLEREIADARRIEDRTRTTIRSELFPRLASWDQAPKGLGGVYEASPLDIERALRGILFAGHVEAADGISVVLDMLPITIAQIGVCTTNYRSEHGEWGHRMFRRDIRGRMENTVDEMIELLEMRRNRTAQDNSSQRDGFNELLRRAFMAWAERAVLARRSRAMWRLGHGNPIAYELLTGSGMASLIGPSVGVLRELLLGHEKFIFVPSSNTDKLNSTIGSALRPLEYAIISTSAQYLRKVLDGGYRGDDYRRAKELYLEPFCQEVADTVVVGAYRVSNFAPPHVFYAHRDHVHQAAIIAMADSALHEHRGFPLLIQLATTLCRTMFHSDSLAASAKLAAADAGPLEYLTEIIQ